ncbi:MAG: OmpA family protein [Cryobacterium sp.]|nr:OmpA family protein [Oligoflexia bacterium]
MSRPIAQPPTPDNRWTLAFAIIMLLLFSLFLILYSSAKKESGKYREEVETLRKERSKPLPSKDTPSGKSESTGTAEMNAEIQAEILADAKTFLAASVGETSRPNVEVLDLASGDFLVRVATPDLFQAGAAKVFGRSEPFVNRLGELILKSGRRLRIEGHADFEDSESIQRGKSSYRNTWELSAARSSALAQYWMVKFDLAPEKIETVGFGHYRPLESTLGRIVGSNRRIEVVILRTEGN